MEKIFRFFIYSFLFLLPWQTIWIFEENFLNGSKWQYGTIEFYATEILLWCATLTFLIWFIKTRKIFAPETHLRFHWTKDRLFVLSLLLFTVYSFISIFWSPVPAVAFQHSLAIKEAFLLFLILYLGPLNWKTAVQWFVSGVLVQSVLALFQFATQSTFAFKWLGLVSHPVMEPGTSVVVGESIGRVLRAYGAFSHPNVLGGFFVFSLVLTTLLLWQNKGRVWLWYGVIALQLAGLFFTFSRSAWLASALWLGGFFVYWFFSKQKKSLQWMPRLAIFVVALCALLTMYFWNIVQTRFVHTSSHEIRSTEERVSGIEEALTLWKQSPWFGVGVGNYTAAAYQLDPTKEGYEYQPVHNVPLLLLTELGITGMLLSLFVLVRLFLIILPSDQKKKRDVLGVLAVVVGVYIALSLFDHYLYSSHTGILFGLGYLALALRFITQVFPSLSKQ